MVRFMSFSSGSCGNCYYLGSENEGILIDAGVSVKRLRTYLSENGLSFDSFSAVLVTHDHLDHIRHLGSYCKRLKKPVYTSRTIHSALARHTFTASYIADCRRVLSEDWEEIGGIRVRYFVVPHDATQTVGYAVEIEGRKFVIMTDIGGSYTYELKMRIVQGNGHLCNDDCAGAIRRFIHPGLRNIFLCHLSENNNTPKLAYEASASAIAACTDVLDRDGSNMPSLRCLPRKCPSQLFML